MDSDGGAAANDGRASGRLAELQRRLGCHSMPERSPAAHADRRTAPQSLQTVLLTGGAAGFSLLAAALCGPLDLPFAAAAAAAAYCAWQSHQDDRRRRLDAWESEQARLRFAREESAYDQLRTLRKSQVLRAYASLRAQARKPIRRGRRSGMVVEDELSQTDLQQFFKSLNSAAHDPDGRAVYIPPATPRAGARDGGLEDEEIARLFGVGGNQLFISEQGASE
ncbi:hypothetical protein [Chromobacterium subtsugae]|uniref:hypothetical protein n=1 Tax=Chromobacterium subtsugae TaxID=251747 RepID=UPI0012D40E9C|nr:hypothetical protein [Chromobacterium subtsugae]